jgi:hypothetical protein
MHLGKHYVNSENAEHPPCRSVYPIKHRHNQCRVIYFQSAIQTDNLKHSCYSQKDDRENRRHMTELIPRILMRKAPGDKLDSALEVLA